MPTGHVSFHRLHAPSGVPIMVAGHRHAVMLVDMVVQGGVISCPILAERAKPCHDLGNSIGTHLMTLLQSFLSVQPPKAHQACVTEAVGVIVGNILATGVGHHNHDMANGNDLVVWKLLGAGYSQ